MRYIKYLFLALILNVPLTAFSQPPTQTPVQFMGTDTTHHELYAYYDLRNRNSYVQITNTGDENPLCIHVQIFQQDRACSELNFNDTLTANDTVVYNMDDLIRNDGSKVPVNLEDDSYGFVAVSAVNCASNEDAKDIVIGNFRIIDNSGYEYRMNMMNDRGGNSRRILDFDDSNPPSSARANIIIPFNTVDGANHADIVGFIVHGNRDLSGNLDCGDETCDKVYNEEAGITFSVFQIDENEERLSCDQKTFACGPGKVMNYGINEDYPASRGNNLLCEGAGLTPNQTNGYISLENATFLSPVTDDVDEYFEFICMVGLNNENGTGSMDECQVHCIDGPGNCED